MFLQLTILQLKKKTLILNIHQYLMFGLTKKLCSVLLLTTTSIVNASSHTNGIFK